MTGLGVTKYLRDYSRTPDGVAVEDNYTDSRPSTSSLSINDVYKHESIPGTWTPTSGVPGQQRDVVTTCSCSYSHTCSDGTPSSASTRKASCLGGSGKSTWSRTPRWRKGTASVDPGPKHPEGGTHCRRMGFEKLT